MAVKTTKIKKTTSTGGKARKEGGDKWKTKTKTVTNVIIIDASGSMHTQVNDVKGGLRQTFYEIKRDSGKYNDMTFRTLLVDFSSDYRVLVDSTNPQDLTDTIADNYTTRSSTALFDAIGRTFAKIDQTEKNVFVTIFTDGEENSSKEFTSQIIKDLIARKKEMGWAVTFVGSTEEAMHNTQSLGLSRGMVDFSSFRSSVGMSGSSNFAGEDGYLSQARSTYYDAAQTDSTKDLVQKDTLLQDAKKQAEEEIGKNKDTK